MKISSLYLLHGAKTALACLTAYIVTHFFNLEFGYWAVISTVIVMQVYVADSMDMCLYRLSGTMIGAAMGAGLILMVPQTPVWIGGALFIATGLCAFLTRYRTRYRMAAITATIIIMTGAASHDIVRFALFRVAEISIGIICAFVVSVLVFPRRRADALGARLLAQAEQCSQLGQDLVAAFVEKQKHIEQAPADILVKDAMENQGYLAAIHRNEVRLYRLEDYFQARVFLMTRTVENLRTMGRILNNLPSEGFKIIMAPEMEQIAKEAGQTLIHLNSGNDKVDTEELSRLVALMENRLADIRKEGLTTRFDLRRLVQVLSFYNSLKYFAEDILDGAKQLNTARGF